MIPDPPKVQRSRILRQSHKGPQGHAGSSRHPEIRSALDHQRLPGNEIWNCCVKFGQSISKQGEPQGVRGIRSENSKAMLSRSAVFR